MKEKSPLLVVMLVSFIQQMCIEHLLYADSVRGPGDPGGKADRIPAFVELTF